MINKRENLPLQSLQQPYIKNYYLSESCYCLEIFTNDLKTLQICDYFQEQLEIQVLGKFLKYSRLPFNNVVLNVKVNRRTVRY